ncbi:MAG: hypothetical protein HY900_31900 [Deltaproteobacteria bacterium]|nr:hypothetical protein [Deltaproteobacteria bacterium]
MSRQRNRRPDPAEPQIERALHPGRFIAYAGVSSFVEGLEEVQAEIAKRVEGEPARAASLYETFLAGCYEKAEEIDDSNGSFSQFVEGLFLSWIKARQASGEDPDETALRLLAWMDDDPYCFCYRIEKDVAKTLDKESRAAFERRVRARFDAATETAASADESSRQDSEYARRRWGEVLRALHIVQRNVKAYVALAEETGVTATDCHAVATLLAGRRKPEEALAWVDRGIEFGEKAPYAAAGYELAQLKRALLSKLGRGDEALEAAWAEYSKHPNRFSYEELMKFVPKPDRAAWHERALKAAMDGNLASAIELLLVTKELELLVERLREASDAALEDLSHFATEPAAEKLEKSHPEVAARLWGAQGMRILNAGKSKYYDAALENFESAQRCFEKAGLTAEWERTVARVRGQHHRKTGFMPGFEELVRGSGPSSWPSFLERAKARWGGQRSG